MGKANWRQSQWKLTPPPGPNKLQDGNEGGQHGLSKEDNDFVAQASAIEVEDELDAEDREIFQGKVP